jgi:hypothetical protein
MLEDTEETAPVEAAELTANAADAVEILRGGDDGECELLMGRTGSDGLLLTAFDSWWLLKLADSG